MPQAVLLPVVEGLAGGAAAGAAAGEGAAVAAGEGAAAAAGRGAAAEGSSLAGKTPGMGNASQNLSKTQFKMPGGIHVGISSGTSPHGGIQESQQ